MGASPNTTGVLKRMANVDTEKHRGRRWPSEDEGRDWGDAAEAKTSSVIASKPPEARVETWSSFSFIPCCNLDLELLAPAEPRENKFLLLKTFSPWYFHFCLRKHVQFQ